MKLATWNINSLTVRLPQVLDWLAANPVDALGLQELKLEESAQEYINAFGEDLMLGHVNNALMETNKKHTCSIKEYTVAPQYIHLDKQGKIQFLIEFESPPADIVAYEAELDKQLQIQNSNYAQKRNNSIALTQLQVIVAKPNLFYNWLESKGNLAEVLA